MKKADAQMVPATSAPDMTQSRAGATGAGASKSTFKGPSASVSTGAAAPLKEVAKNFFRIQKAELSITDMKAPELQPKAEMFRELVENSQPSVRLGMISRCAVPGCDVHFVDESQNIMEHVPAGQRMEDRFQAARELVSTMPNSFMAIVVYTDRFEALLANGTTVPFP